MCEKFGKSPTYYLFGDLIECIHFRLAIDMTVFNIWASWDAEIRRQQEKKANLRRLADANSK